MKNLILLFVFLLPVLCKAQSTKSYYLDGSYKLLESKKKAIYFKTETKNADTLAIEVSRLKDKEIVSREFYLRDEPIGKWVITKGYRTRLLNYDFNLRYSAGICKKSDSALFIDTKIFSINPFIDNDSLGYKAPKIATGEGKIGGFIQNNFSYPPQAVDIGYEGTVMVLFIISEKGEIEDVAVLKKGFTSLDKEAMRIVKSLKFLNPPSLKGKPGKLCLAVPVTFAVGE